MKTVYKSVSGYIHSMGYTAEGQKFEERNPCQIHHIKKMFIIV